MCYSWYGPKVKAARGPGKEHISWSVYDSRLTFFCPHSSLTIFCFILFTLIFHTPFLVSSLPPFLHDILMNRQTIGKFWLFLPDSLFSPNAPLTKGPLLPWNLNICQIHLKFKRPICHFRKNRHSPRGPFCPMVFRLIFHFRQIRQFCQLRHCNFTRSI